MECTPKLSEAVVNVAAPALMVPVPIVVAPSRNVTVSPFGGSPDQENSPEGAEIVVDGYQSKDGALRANGHDITFAEGKKLFVGSSAPVGSSEPPAK